MWCKCKRLQAAVPVVHRVGVIREWLRGRYVDVGPVWFGCWGRRGWGMMEWGHRGATGGRHWAGGLHSCRLLLLIGTKAKKIKKKRSKTCPVLAGFGVCFPLTMLMLHFWFKEFHICFVLYVTNLGKQIYLYSCGSVSVVDMLQVWLSKETNHHSEPTSYITEFTYLLIQYLEDGKDETFF